MPGLQPNGGWIERIMPAAPSGKRDLNKSPIASANTDHFCRVICSPDYNNGCRSFSGGTSGYQEAYDHDNIFHAVFFISY